ncbi:MAG: 16S rRNA (cytosine(1402)-N(4))-methyltransferase, partial [Bacteroidia bacterium]|nr:16S rRNA (cytosine(1402)-N(4))-methyltransferase [Bacteroidia bacterium]
AHIFKTYGEIKNGYALAKRIVSARTTGSITTTRQLNEIAAPLAASKNSNKYLAQVYQALRIIVNDELGALEDLLYQSTLILKSGGKLVIISYHSLEDRLVKNFFKSGNTQGKLEKDFYGNLITPFTTPKKQPLMPTEEEQHNNPRSRSARLRIGTKI